jgi:hypothetical protein
MRLLTPILYAAVFGAAVYLAVSQSPLPEAAASAPADGTATASATTPSTASTSAPTRMG